MEQDYNNDHNLENTHYQDPEKPVEEHHRLDRQQKISIAVIAVIGIGVLVLGFWQFRRTVEVPFPDFSKDKTEEQSPVLEDTRDETLKDQDTDSDGLNDYDEVYVYQTSPYLNDSDSDGYLDKEEIENGYDPNCPSGQNCFNESFEDVVTQTPAPAGNGQQAEGVEMTADEIRAELLATGMVDEQTLNSVDDASLLQLYEQSMGEPSTPEGVSSVNDLYNLSADEVRQILIDEGMDPEQLNQIDDETILKMYKDTLDEVQKEQEE